jgi:hypothetical protein
MDTADALDTCPDVRFGSLAVITTNISLTTALGGKADVLIMVKAVITESKANQRKARRQISHALTD